MLQSSEYAKIGAVLSLHQETQMALYLVCRRQLKAIDSSLQSGKNPVCDREGVGYSFAGIFLGAYTLFIVRRIIENV